MLHHFIFCGCWNFSFYINHLLSEYCHELQITFLHSVCRQTATFLYHSQCSLFCLTILQPDTSRHLYFKFCSLPLQSCYIKCRVHAFRWEEHFVKWKQAVLKISIKVLYHHSPGMTGKPVNIISLDTWCQFKVWSTHLDIPGNTIIRL